MDVECWNEVEFRKCKTTNCGNVKLKFEINNKMIKSHYFSAKKKKLEFILFADLNATFVQMHGGKLIEY